MIINNLGEDTKKLLKMEGETTYSIADKVDMTPANIVRTYKNGTITKNFIKVLEALGYDIKITYVKREKTAEEILKRGTK